MSLDLLISPTTRAEFFADIWERRVLHAPRRNPHHFAMLRAGLNVEEIVWQTCHTWGDVSLARANTDYEQSPYASLTPSVDVIRRAFRDGYTIVINDFQRKQSEVARFCRALEADLIYSCNANLYATRAGTQGLNYHYDSQDVFVAQLEGTKTWRIFASPVTLPLGDEPYIHLDCSKVPYIEYELAPGDMLYVPRGVVHEARGVEGTSIHLTFSVSATSWVSFLQRLLYRIGRNDTRLRQSIPVAILQGEQPSEAHNVIRHLRDLLTNIADRSHLGDTLSELLVQLLGEKARLPSSAMVRNTDPNPVTLETAVSVAADQIAIVDESSGKLTLRAIGISIDLAPELKRSVEYLCSRKRCKVSDIPGELNSTEKLALVSRMIECGLLVQLEAEARGPAGPMSRPQIA